MEAFTRTLGNCWGLQPPSSLIPGERSSPKGAWISEADFLSTGEDGRTLCRPGPGVTPCCVSSACHLPPLTLRLTDFSRAASLSKGLISILQHYFQDNVFDQFSSHVLPSLRGITHFWWQWIDYKETGGECSAFWRLTRIGWGLDSSLTKHCLPSFPSCPTQGMKRMGLFDSGFSPEWLFCQSVLNLVKY